MRLLGWAVLYGLVIALIWYALTPSLSPVAVFLLSAIGFANGWVDRKLLV